MKEAECYIKRYPDIKFDKLSKPNEDWEKLKKHVSIPNDLNVDFARRHYEAFGHFEDRNRYCAERITDIQAKCYLENYEDLQQKFGKNWEAARQHYYTIGYRQKRSFDCQPYEGQPPDVYKPKMVRIQNDTAPFTCNGDIHYTRYSSKPQIKPKEGPEPWEKVRNFDFYTISSNGTEEFTCNNDNLNSRSFIFHKQCFCEIRPREKPRLCAKEGQTCNSCSGQIIYGPSFKRKKNQGGKKTHLGVDEMINTQFWVKTINMTADSKVKCEDATFNLGKRRDKSPR